MSVHLNPIADLRRGFNALADNIPFYRGRSVQVQVGRTVIALGQLLTLTLTQWANLTADVLGRTPETHCAGVRQISLFCVGNSTPSELGRWVGIMIALLVISGFFPRFTSILHAWLAVSMSVSLSVPDGGEAVAVFSTVLLVGVLVGDSRINGWSRNTGRVASGHLKAIGYAASIALCLQLAGIYFESGLAKLAVPDWANGSAMFYIVRDPMFGSVGPLGSALQWITSAPLGTAMLTWGTILLEVTLAVLFLCPAPLKKYALVGVIVLHLAIAVSMGLWTFSLAMIGTAIVAAYTLSGRPIDSGFEIAQRDTSARADGASSRATERGELVNS